MQVLTAAQGNMRKAEIHCVTLEKPLLMDFHVHSLILQLKNELSYNKINHSPGWKQLSSLQLGLAEDKIKYSEIICQLHFCFMSPKKKTCLIFLIWSSPLFPRDTGAV